MNIKENNEYKINGKVWNVFQIIPVADCEHCTSGQMLVRLDGWGEEPIAYLDVEFSQMIEDGEVEEVK